MEGDGTILRSIKNQISDCANSGDPNGSPELYGRIEARTTHHRRRYAEVSSGLNPRSRHIEPWSLKFQVDDCPIRVSYFCPSCA